MFSFQPALLPIKDIERLVSVSNDTNFFVYGEVHGIRENADVVYSLATYLGIERIAVENDSSVRAFIDAACQGHYDFSLIDTDVFDSSILSLEMAKAIVTLINEGKVKEVVYIDTYFDGDNQDEDDGSPQEREKKLADNILALNDSMKTLCLMGQWHTQPKPVILPKELGYDKGAQHHSALYRVRNARPGVVFVHSVYRKGKLLNAGNIIDMPECSGLPDIYTITKVSDIDFDLSVPDAHIISLPSFPGSTT